MTPFFKKIIFLVFVLVFGVRIGISLAAVPVYVVGGFLHGFINKGVGTDNPVCPSKGLPEEGVQITYPSGGTSAPPTGCTGNQVKPHRACQNNACVSVDSCGTDSCNDNSDCSSPPPPPPPGGCPSGQVKPSYRCVGASLSRHCELVDQCGALDLAACQDICEPIDICPPGGHCDEASAPTPDLLADFSKRTLSSITDFTKNLLAPPPPPDDDDGGGGGGGGGGNNDAVVGMNFDEILWRFLCTFKDYQEHFTFNYLNAKAEKDRIELTKSLVGELKAFELAKIEKAREDVNKLIQETIKELKDQPLVITDASNLIDNLARTNVQKILRLNGLSVEGQLVTLVAGIACPTGILVNAEPGSSSPECWVIKQSSRVVENLDDYLYEEALQKSRDAIMCLLAPWNHWPLGEYNGEVVTTNVNGSTTPTYIDDFIFGRNLGFCDETAPFPYDVQRTTTLNECSTQYICAIARRQAGLRPDMFSPHFEDYKQKLCPSDRIKEDLKREFLTSLMRKHRAIEFMPPEIWYYGKSMYPNSAISDETIFQYDDSVRPGQGGPPQAFILNDEYCQNQGLLPNITLQDRSLNYCLPYDPSFSIGRCTFILENLGLGKTGSYFAQYSGGPVYSKIFSSQRRYLEVLVREIREFFPSIPLSIDVKRKHRLYIDDPTEYERAKEDKNNLEGLKRTLTQLIAGVGGETKEKNILKYGAGSGIKPLQYLFGWNVCDDANKIAQMDNAAGQTVCNELKDLYRVCEFDGTRCQGAGYYFFETDDIISPAIFLLNKIAASIQSEFDLAMMAWKEEPESSDFERETQCPLPHCATKDDFNCWWKETEEYSAKKLYFPESNVSKPIREKRIEYEKCIFKARDNLTQTHIGTIEIDPAERRIIRFPKILPAPWEDLDKYLNLKNGWGDFIDNYCGAFKDKQNCEERHYLRDGGFPFCQWYDDKQLIVRWSQDSAKRTQDGVCRYNADRVLVYDTDLRNDVYRNIDPGVNIDPWSVGERAPGFSGRGQYFNRLYRETIQLFEKPLGEALLDWYQPQIGTTSCFMVQRSSCNNNARPECVFDSQMEICRQKTCEEIDRLVPKDKRAAACEKNLSCIVTVNPIDGEIICRHR